MKSIDKENLRIELKDIIRNMDIPESRYNLTNHNLLWLKRNLGIRNMNHSSFYRAMYLINLLTINEQ